MKKMLVHKNIFVGKSKLHGYGVFTKAAIKKGEIIEECYFILTKGGDKVLEQFYFDAKGKYAVFLGFGSIYNHHEEPNAHYTLNIKNRITTIKATRNLRKNEEIFISYGPKWFSSRGLEPKTK